MTGRWYCHTGQANRAGLAADRDTCPTCETADEPAYQPRGTRVGRDRELAFLRGFFQEAAVSGGAVLLSGDPGVGKTVLLNGLADSASAAGTTVLRAAGAEFEGEISFAGLNQLLFPLLGDLDGLGPDHRDALRVALGFGAGPPPDRLLVSSAALVLLQRVAARTPLLLIVDDLPWIDRASAGVLSFVARRLAGSRTGLLAACRTGAHGYFDRVGLPEYELKPLDDQAATELVAAQFPGLDPQVRSRVLGVAQGNPLALLELPQALTAFAALGGGAAALGAPARPAPAAAIHRTCRAATARDPGLPPSGGPRGHRGPALAHRSGRRRLPARRPRSGRARPPGTGRREPAHGDVSPSAHPRGCSRGVDRAERRRTHRDLAAALLDQPERRA